MTSYAAIVTVPSGTVGSTLTGFPVRVDLADLPAAWWDAYDENVNAIRVKSSGTDVPMDVVTIDAGTRTGVLYFKATLSSGSNNVYTVEVVDGQSAWAATDTYGRNNVWTAYTAFAEGWEPTTDRTGNGHDPVQSGTLASYYTVTNEITGTRFEQGVAWDGTNWYSCDGNVVRKINTSGTDLVVNSDLATSAGNPGFDHAGGMCVVGSELFIACSNYPASTVQMVVVLNTSDLSFNRLYNIHSSGIAEPSDICWNSDDSIFVLTDFNNAPTLHTFDSTFTTHGTLTLPSGGASSKQGIHWSGGDYFIMSGPLSGTSVLNRVADDMTGTMLGMWAGPAHRQGLTAKVTNTVTPDLYNASASGVLLKMTYATPAITPVPGWVAFPGTGHYGFPSMPKYTSWSMGATVKLSAAPSANRGIMSYGFGTTSGNRASLLAQDGPDRWAFWNSTNGFMGGTTINTPTTGQELNVVRAMAVTESTTTDRRMYRNGVVDGTPAACAQRPAGGTNGTMEVSWGASDSGGNERLASAISTRAWVAGSVLTADWLKGQYDSWEGATFYKVAPAIVVDGLIPPVTGDVTLGFTSDVTVSGTVGPVTGTVSITSPGIELTVDGLVPPVTGSVSLDIPGVVVDGTVGPVTGDVTVTIPADGWRDALLDVAGTDLLAWYRHNDPLGGATVMRDSSGNGHDGVITYRANGPTAAPALVSTGGAIKWGGNGALPEDAGTAAVADGGWFDPSDGWTVGMWIDVTGLSLGSQQWLVSKASSFVSAISTSSTIIVTGYNTSTGLGGTSGVISAGRHLLIWSLQDDVTNAAGHSAMQAYLDGVRFANNTPPAANTNTVDHAEPITFGYQNGNGDFPLWGAQDETFIIGRALTQSEIDELYVAGLAAEMTVSGTVPPVTGDVTLTLPPNFDMTADGLVPAVTGDVTVELSPAFTVDGLVPAVTGDVTLDLVPISFVTVDGVVGPVTGTVDLRPPMFVTVDGLVPPVTGDVDVHGADTMGIDGVVGPVTGSVTFVIPPQTDMRNRVAGRSRDGIGVVFYEPPVDPRPDFSVADFAFVSARAFGPVTMVGAQPTFSVARQAVERLRDRILVGGVDITHFRGVTTPAPSYGLVVPLLYGSGRLPLPQVAAAFEHAGVGDLWWAAKGSTVLVQRVNDSNEVVATDYVGFVVAHDVSGRNLVLELGGEATGRAAMIDKQPPLFFKRNDLGFWWWGAIQELGLHFEPRLGPDTGIVLRNAGGMDHLSYIQDLSAKGTRRSGAQLTCMPDAREDGGAYRVVEKDLTTIHATVYLDDAVSVPDVRDDMAEQPNRIYATGVTPAGMRVKFGAYPILSNDTPPPYPMTDGSDFGVGTTDADTDTGDGVSVMIWRLVKAGYLALEDKPGGYDAQVAEAVIDLKIDALDGDDTPTFFDGDMTEEAWAALFDASATGYSLAGTQILPAAQRTKTRKWTRTSNGSVIARNDRYDPTVIKVDATIDTGVGMSRKQIRGFARGELTPVGENHHTGTITLNSGAVIRGEHTPGDPVFTGDIMDARELRPLMNLWAPLFAGGTLFQITGVERSNAGGVETITLDVDTRARDTMKAWEVIARNRESRRSPARAWLNQHRSSTLTKDAVGEFDEIGGVLDDRVNLAGGGWTVFPTVAGQEGTIRSLRFETSPPTEFVAAVFGREITTDQLDDAIGNPLTKGGKKRWVDEAVRRRLDDDHVLLYSAGEKRAPCGYYPGQKHPDDTVVDTDDDDATEPAEAWLTGDWFDDAGFSYHTFEAPVLWVAIWAADAAHLSPGRIMWPQLEAGS